MRRPFVREKGMPHKVKDFDFDPWIGVPLLRLYEKFLLIDVQSEERFVLRRRSAAAQEPHPAQSQTDQHCKKH